MCKEVYFILELMAVTHCLDKLVNRAKLANVKHFTVIGSEQKSHFYAFMSSHKRDLASWVICGSLAVLLI